MSKLLINEPPLQVLPSLATLIGLNEAIFLQQLHYWISNPKIGVNIEGRRYVRNTVAEWQVDNFPFWSINTIRRTIASLEDAGLVLTRADLNAAAYDKTRWYSIDYEALEKATTQNGQSVERLPKMGRATTQNGYIDVPILGNTIPETTSETTSEIDGDCAAMSPAEEFPEAPEPTDRSAALDAVQVLGLFNSTDRERFNDLWPELAGRVDWIGRAVTVTRDAAPRAPVAYCLKVLANSVHTNTPPGNNGNGNRPRPTSGHTAADLDAIFGVDIHGNPV